MIAPPHKGDGSVLWTEPQLFVTNVARACEFYARKLGLTVVFQIGEPAFYAQVMAVRA